MIRPERERLIARIRQLRRISAGPVKASPDATERPDTARVDRLETRIGHLEQLVEGLQDSVHRETARQSKRIAELEAQVQPGAMGAALDRDARDRGL